MKTTRLIAISLLLSSAAYAGPSCVWDLESTDIKTVKGNQLTIERFDCQDEPGWSSEYVSDIFKAHVVNNQGDTINLGTISDEFEKINVLAMPEDFPATAIHFYQPGASNVGNSIRIYDDNWNEIETIRYPLNKYQSTNRQGSERKLVGFFKVADDYYIEKLEAKPGAECNACRQSEVVTYRATTDGLVKVDVRDYDIKTYKRFGTKE